MPFVKYTTVSGEHYALLDTGCDNTIILYRGEDVKDIIYNNISISGFGGENKSASMQARIYFELVEIQNGSMTMDCDAVLASEAFFLPFKQNDMPEVEMILGMNFLTKYQAKIDLKNKILMLK